jgi:hypothetical protein
LVEVRVQDLSVVKETRPPLPKDRVAREARCLLAAQKKEEKDTAKKRQVRKALEQEALKKRRHQQSLDGLPLEESPSEMVSGENDDDGDDDDAWSRYDAVTSLADLPDVCPFLETIGGRPPRRRERPRRPLWGRESQERRRPERVPQRAASSGAPQEGSVVPPPRAQAPRAQTAVGAAASASASGAPSTGVKT